MDIAQEFLESSTIHGLFHISTAKVKQIVMNVKEAFCNKPNIHLGKCS